MSSLKIPTNYKPYIIAVLIPVMSFVLFVVCLNILWVLSPQNITVVSIYPKSTSNFLANGVVDNTLMLDGSRIGIENTSDFMLIASEFEDSALLRYREFCRVRVVTATKCQLLIVISATSSEGHASIYTVVDALATSQSLMYPGYTFTTKELGLNEGLKDSFKPSLNLILVTLPFSAGVLSIGVFGSFLYLAKKSTT